MNTFARSWEITKLSMKVIKAEKELILFPILSAIFSIIFLILMIIPLVMQAIVLNISYGANLPDWMFWPMIFIIYLGLSIIATFFNVCTVYTIKTRFDGKNAQVGKTFKFAFSKIHLIFYWGLVSATVGLLLRILDGIAEKMEGLGEIIGHIVVSLIGAAWSILTIFVVPTMVYKGLTPIDAVKYSAHTLKKTWGESLVREIGTGFIALLAWIFGILVFGVLVFIALPAGLVPIIIIAAIAVLYFVAVTVFFQLVNAVFNTALFVYAETGKVPAYKEEILKGTFRRK